MKIQVEFLKCEDCPWFSTETISIKKRNVQVFVCSHYAYSFRNTAKNREQYIIKTALLTPLEMMMCPIIDRNRLVENAAEYGILNTGYIERIKTELDRMLKEVKVIDE